MHKAFQFIIYFVEVYTMFSNKLLMCKLILFGSLPQMFWRHCSSWFLKKLLREEWLIVLNLLKQQLDRFKTTSEFESTYLQENKKSPLSWLTSNFIYWASLGFSIKKLNFSIMHPKWGPSPPLKLYFDIDELDFLWNFQNQCFKRNS